MGYLGELLRAGSILAGVGSCTWEPTKPLQSQYLPARSVIFRAQSDKTGLDRRAPKTSLDPTRKSSRVSVKRRSVMTSDEPYYDKPYYFQCRHFGCVLLGKIRS